MACIYPAPSQSPEILYPYVAETLKTLIAPEENWIANAGNASAALKFLVHDLNWVGFYLSEGDVLRLGPFSGKPAVTEIPIGQGVCGTAAKTGETIVVPDVHQFPGHIACDLFSNSEIVIPLFKNGKLIGVLDIDSPEINRFSDEDILELKKLAAYLAESIHFPVIG